MYPINIYRRDTSDYAALIAPRAALFCFADDDRIFHPAEAAALVKRTQRVYALYGARDRCRLVTCPGGHGDHDEFDKATAAWFDRHVAGETRPMAPRGGVEVAEPEMAVFNGRPPMPDHLDLLPHLLSPRGGVSLPDNLSHWTAIRRNAIGRLVHLTQHAPDASFAPSGSWNGATGIFATHRGSIAGMEAWLHVLEPKAEPRRIILGVAAPGQGALDHVGCISRGTGEAATAAGFEGRRGGIKFGKPFSSAATRAGVLEWSIAKLLAFAMPLTGMTPVMLTIEDIGAVLDYLDTHFEGNYEEVILYGTGECGIAALYRAVLDERVSGVIAEHIPPSHADGYPIPGILRAFDIPQAVGLVAPRKIALIDPGHAAWTWPTRVFARLGCPERFQRCETLREAIDGMMA